MQLIFLGTAASEGYPNAFCDCENCTAARRAGGPSLRKRSAALVNDDLLIDLGPDLMAAAQQHGVVLASIHYCLQTHEHHDHFDPTHLHSRSQYCGVYGNPPLHYYLSASAQDKLNQHIAPHLGPEGLLDEAMAEALNLQIHQVQPFDQLQIGPYRVLAVRARHAPELIAMLYVISREGRTLFYCTDTGDLPDETWQAMVSYGRQFNVVVMDHTFGLKERSGGHMNREQFVEQIEKMRSHNLLAGDARIYATHLGHHSNPVHEELAAQASEYGYLVAYDGLVVEV
jgi:phosphoribosyl 1,2-cyclic phosphate phosphodiesterase